MKSLLKPSASISSVVVLCAALGVACSSNNMDPVAGDQDANADVNAGMGSGSNANVDTNVDTNIDTGVENTGGSDNSATPVDSSGSDNDSNSNAGESTDTDTDANTDEPAPDQGAAATALEHTALIYIAEETGSTGLSVTAKAHFYSITTPLINDPSLKSSPNLDTCEIGSESSQINAQAFDLPIDHVMEATGGEILQVNAVSAGDTAELTSSEGSFASLMQSEVDGIVEYTIQDGADLSTLVPDTLTVTVSGDSFPLLSTNWVTPTRLNDSLRDDIRGMPADPMLRWDGAQTTQNMQSQLHVYAGFLDELTGEYRSYNCVLEDDGEFVIPDAIMALYDGGVSPNFVDIARYSRSIEFVDNLSVVNMYMQRF